MHFLVLHKNNLFLREQRAGCPSRMQNTLWAGLGGPCKLCCAYLLRRLLVSSRVRRSYDKSLAPTHEESGTKIILKSYYYRLFNTRTIATTTQQQGLDEPTPLEDKATAVLQYEYSTTSLVLRAHSRRLDGDMAIIWEGHQGQDERPAMCCATWTVCLPVCRSWSCIELQRQQQQGKRER